MNIWKSIFCSCSLFRLFLHVLFSFYGNYTANSLSLVTCPRAGTTETGSKRWNCQKQIVTVNCYKGNIFFFQNSAWCGFVFLEPPNGACHPFRSLSNVPKTFRPWEKTLPLVLVRHKNWSLPWVLAKQALSFTLYTYISSLIAYIYVPSFMELKLGLLISDTFFKKCVLLLVVLLFFYFFNTLRYPHSSCFYILPHSGNWAIT